MAKEQLQIVLDKIKLQNNRDIFEKAWKEALKQEKPKDKPGFVRRTNGDSRGK